MKQKNEVQSKNIVVA